MPRVQVSATASVPAKEASISATVIRCGCGNPRGVHPGQPCPTPRAVEDQGVVSYYHRNPLRRAWWDIKQAWKAGRSR